MREFLLALTTAKVGDHVFERLWWRRIYELQHWKRRPRCVFDTLIVRGDRLTHPEGSRVRKDIVRRMYK